MHPQETRQEYLDRLARRNYAHILGGMGSEEVWFITITRGRDTQLTLRNRVFRRLSARIRRRWPDAAFVTVYEYSDKRGAHLHILAKNIPGFTHEWLEKAVKRLNANLDEPPCKVDSRIVCDRYSIASYMCKQRRNRQIADGWPKNFHPATFSRNWCPTWLSASAWRRKQVAGGAAGFGAGRRPPW